MTRQTKSNAWIIVFCILFITLFIIQPAKYMLSTARGITIWFNAVVPSLFPFFFASKILTSALPPFPRPATSIFLISIVSGYPVGAKLLSDKCKTGEISAEYCTRALALCSTSGPLFLLGTVGIGIFHSYKAGIILLISHVLGSIINGLIYRKKTKTKIVPIQSLPINVGDSMYESVISIFMVGGFITLSYIIVDMLISIGVLDGLANIISTFTHANFTATKGVLAGIVEMTRGCIEISMSNISLPLSLIICSALIGFAGISVFLQTICFLPKQINKKKILLQKITQSIFCMFFCAIFCIFAY